MSRYKELALGSTIVLGGILWFFCAGKGSTSDILPAKSAAKFQYHSDDTQPHPLLSGSHISAFNSNVYEPSPERLAGLAQGWRPFGNLMFRAETAYVLDLNDHERRAFEHCCRQFLNSVGSLLASDCEVVQSSDGIQYVYFPPNSEAWDSIKGILNRELVSAIGEAKAEYILRTSSNDFDLLTGGFGRHSRVAKVEILQARPDGRPTLPYSIEIMQGAGMLANKSAFSPTIRSQIQRDAKSSPPWSAVYQFDAPPEFLREVIEFQGSATQKK